LLRVSNTDSQRRIGDDPCRRRGKCVCGLIKPYWAEIHSTGYRLLATAYCFSIYIRSARIVFYERRTGCVGIMRVLARRKKGISASDNRFGV
jgi:hypothetical protein